MRKLLIVAAAVLAALLAGACGSSGDEGPGVGSPENKEAKREKPTAVEMVRVAYEETAAEQTAKTAMEMTTVGPPVEAGDTEQAAPMVFTLKAEGVVDFSGAASSTTMDMGAMGSMQMRQVDGILYMRMPDGFVAQTPGAKPWVEMDLNKMYEEQYGTGPMEMQGTTTQDPSRQLEYLRGVSDSVEKVSKEEVRGVPTTRYRAIVNLNKEAARQDAEVREAYDATIEQLGTSRIPMEVWLDGKNRVRRFAMDMKVHVPENTDPEVPENGKMRTSVVIDYYDFGTAVNVEAPPKDQTMDGQKLLEADQQSVAQ